MPKMCAIPQYIYILVSVSFNPIPTVEHFRRNHPQREHSYRQGIRVGKQPKKCNALNNKLNTHIN